MSLGTSNKTEQRIRALLDYWLSLRDAHGSVPLFSDFDPIEVPWALSSIAVIDKIQEEFVYRLVGDNVNSRHPDGIKGKPISKVMPPDSAALIETRWQRVLQDPSICVARTSHLAKSGAWVLAWRLVLPFVGKEGDTSVIVSFATYEEPTTANDDILVSAETQLESWQPVMSVDVDAALSALKNHRKPLSADC